MRIHQGPASPGSGSVGRSSALFYFRSGGGFATRLHLFDYWRIKRGIDVGLVVSIRDAQGNLLRREAPVFDSSPVIELNVADAPEGSVEVEAFSSRDLVIPYAAVTAEYLAPRSVCLVHSYSRAYDQREIEQGLVVSPGEEMGWTLRDGPGVSSIGILHNGSLPRRPQTVRLRIVNGAGETVESEVLLGALKPHEIARIEPARHVADLTRFLRGGNGYAALSFRADGVFPRMLVGNETRDEIQLTHSNFDYGRHEAGEVEGEGALRVPGFTDLARAITVYPQRAEGVLRICGPEGERLAEAGRALRLPWSAPGPGLFRVRGAGRRLPTRVVTGLELAAGGLPVETSMGIYHARFPRQRFRWGAIPREGDAEIHLHDASPCQEAAGPDVEVQLRLYSALRSDFLERTVQWYELQGRGGGVPVRELFGEAERFLESGPGAFTIFSEYPWLFPSVAFRRGGSLAFEHAF